MSDSESQDAESASSTGGDLEARKREEIEIEEVLEGFGVPAQDAPHAVDQIMRVFSESTVGNFPPPMMLGRYDEVMPGLANRIVVAAEHDARFHARKATAMPLQRFDTCRNSLSHPWLSAQDTLLAWPRVFGRELACRPARAPALSDVRAGMGGESASAQEVRPPQRDRLLSEALEQHPKHIFLF